MELEKPINVGVAPKLKLFRPTNAQSAGSTWSESLTCFDMGSKTRFFVYIPKVIMDVKNNTHYLSFKQHGTRNATGAPYYHTCIKGIAGEDYAIIENALKRVQGSAYVDLGYTGDCPFCVEMDNVWAGYNKKCNVELAKHDNDEHDYFVQHIKRQMVDVLPIRPSNDYVMFPIVLIPVDNDFTLPLASDWLEKCEILMVVWSKNYYNKKITQSLDPYYGKAADDGVDYSSPTGLFWTWFFGGAPTDPRMAMRDSVHIPFKRGGLDQEKAHLDALVVEYLKYNSDMLLSSLYAPIQAIKETAGALMVETHELLKNSTK